MSFNHFLLFILEQVNIVPEIYPNWLLKLSLSYFNQKISALSGTGGYIIVYDKPKLTKNQIKVLEILKRSKKVNCDLDAWYFEDWWGDEIKKESESLYLKYQKVSPDKRRDNAYNRLNSLVKKGYVEKLYKEHDTIRYRLKDQYDNLV